MKILKITYLLSVCFLLIGMAGCDGGESRPSGPITIEYDEQVKLHTGEMIVVHMKRRYSRGDMVTFSSKPEFAWPLDTEISWDTGFPGVGRKTLKFTEKTFCIDRFEEGWIIIGTWNLGLGQPPMGYFYHKGRGIVIINTDGSFRVVNEVTVDRLRTSSLKTNINDFTNIPYDYEGKLLTWPQKLAYDLGPQGRRVLRPKK